MSLATFNGTVFFDELATSPDNLSGSRPNESQYLNRSVTRTGVILSAELEQLLLECFPPPPSLPGQHPVVPYLYADNVSCTGIGLPSCVGGMTNTVNAYTFLECTITYSPLQYGINRVSRSATTSIIAMPHQVHTLSKVTGFTPPFNPGDPPGSGIYEGEKITAENLPVYHFYPQEQIQYTYENIPITDYDTIKAISKRLIGRVNREIWQGYEPETVLYEGMSEDYAVNPVGVTTFTATFNFSVITITIPGQQDAFGRTVFGHNHYFVADGGNSAGGRYHYVAQRLYVDPVKSDANAGDWPRLPLDPLNPQPVVRNIDPILPLTNPGESFDELFFGTFI